MSAVKPKHQIPTSKLGRLARLAGLAQHGIPFAFEAAKRARERGGPAGQDGADEKMAAEVKRAAEALVETLGEMKGLPLKLGQMASYIDGFAPPGFEEPFQNALKGLLDQAPALAPEAAAQMVETELGGRPEALFGRWEPRPFAAASIGQVHRAVTREGADVAVKVQYPGIERAFENDLKSMSVLQSMISPLSKKLQVPATLDELRKVFLEELDYGREAGMADLFRRVNADDPEMFIPEVHGALTTRRVLTLGFVGGVGYAEFCREASQEARNRAGSTIWRFTLRSMLRHGLLYADPHPGNYRFLDDGRVAFLDFGCVRVLSPDLVDGMKRYMKAAMDDDWAEFDRACVEVLGYEPNDESWEVYRGYTKDLLVPLCQHGTWQYAPEKVRATINGLAQGLNDLKFKKGERLPTIPYVPKASQELTFVHRLHWGLASVLAGLRTEAPFRRLSEPWIREGMRPLPAKPPP